MGIYDLKSTIYTDIAKSLRDKYEDIFVTGEAINMPSQYPCVSIQLKDDFTYTRSQDNNLRENHVNYMIETSVWSNLETGKISQCESIMSDVNNIMQQYFTTKTTCRPVESSDKDVYKMVSRYVGVLELNTGLLYRR